jgi:hypothetical protein
MEDQIEEQAPAEIDEWRQDVEKWSEVHIKMIPTPIVRMKVSTFKQVIDYVEKSAAIVPVTLKGQVKVDDR